jgi:hypothetical protein
MNALKQPVFHSLFAATVLASIAGCGRPPSVVDLGGMSVAAEPGKAGEPTPKPPVLPDDQGGKAVGQLLAPAGGREVTPPAKAPVPLAVPPALTDSPLPPAQVAVPRRPLTAQEKGLRPRSPAEDPLSLVPSTPPVVPSRPTQPSRALTRVSSPDVNEPVPLTIIGLPVADRIPLDDPTAEASLQAALSTGVPVRTTPVPFTPTTVSDPFQNAEIVRLRTPPPEDSHPPRK